MKKISLVLLIFLLPLCLIPPTSAAYGEGWLDGWDSRMTVSITNSTGAGTNYQVYLNVPYVEGMQVDFDDLRFTDDDGFTLLDYWLEEWIDSSYAKIWVEVADNLNSTQIIYMYYGNDAVSTISNGEDTFLFYEDWASETVDPAKWDTITSDGSISFDDTFADQGSMIKIEGNAGTNVYELRTVSTVTASTSIIAKIKIESTVAASQRTIWGMGSLAAAPLTLLRSIEGTEDFLALDDDSNSDSAGVDGSYFDADVKLMITRDGTSAKLWKDYSLGYTVSCEPDTNANAAINLYVRDSEYDLYCDWTAQRKFVDPEPSALIGDWQDAGEAKFIFPIGWDPTFQFGFDAFFIIAGLIMIPVSTLYLVRGGRKEMSMDKLFYALILFFVGCGLLIGGILPP